MEALIAEYAVERAAWRAILGLVHPLHVYDVVGAGPDAGADAPPWWPDEYHDPPADLGADDEAARLEMVAMLGRELGAITLEHLRPRGPHRPPLRRLRRRPCPVHRPRKQRRLAGSSGKDRVTSPGPPRAERLGRSVRAVG